MERQYWNESMSSSDLVSIQLDTMKHFKRCFGFDKTCIIPFDTDAGFVQIILINMYPWFYFRQLQPVTSGFSLVLPNSLDGCTNILPIATAGDASQHQADTTLFRYCICCGLYNPNISLNCPVSPLQSPPHVCPTTTIPVKQDQITCDSVTAYYTGLFRNQSNFAHSFQARFQVKYDMDKVNRRVLLTNQYWDSTVSNANDFRFSILNETKEAICDPLRPGCSIHYNENTPNIRSYIVTKTQQNNYGFHLFYVDKINDGFLLKNVTGQCANYPILDPDQVYAADPDLYLACACCGDYNPHPSLLCPPNPWQTHTVAN
ncbi:hypothetical protein M3Y97_01168400 [Aphelenchoides bicaudatus]|nr:hypothetical protein M3Y97_01168400 [Aphelenchoides bicaudatus]